METSTFLLHFIAGRRSPDDFPWHTDLALVQGAHHGNLPQEEYRFKVTQAEGTSGHIARSCACVGKLDLAKGDDYNGRHGDRPVAYSWGFTHPEECEGKMHAGHSPTPIGPYTNYLEQAGLLKAFHDDYTGRSAVSADRKPAWVRDRAQALAPEVVEG